MVYQYVTEGGREGERGRARGRTERQEERGAGEMMRARGLPSGRQRRAGTACGITRGRRTQESRIVYARCASSSVSASNTRDGAERDANEAEKKSVFVFGADGFVGRALVRALADEGCAWDVHGTVRSRNEESKALGSVRDIVKYEYEAVSLREGDHSRSVSAQDSDGSERAMLHALTQATHILCTIPPLDSATLIDDDPVLEAISASQRRAPPGRLQWVGYLSSTSVYGGDRVDELIDEESEPRPSTEKANLRLAAEERWMAGGSCGALLPIHIFRLGGIYGPQRSIIETIKNEGRERHYRQGPTQANIERRRLARYTSRIHIDDVISTLVCSMRSPSPGSVYNVVDDDPAPRLEVEAFARELLYGGSESDEVAQSGWDPRSSTKRVSNSKIKQELGVELKHPGYQSGLRAILDGGD